MFVYLLDKAYTTYCRWVGKKGGLRKWLAVSFSRFAHWYQAFIEIGRIYSSPDQATIIGIAHEKIVDLVDCFITIFK